MNQVEGGETSPDAPVDAQTPSKGNPMKRIISSTDLTTGLFQELYDAFESDQFDVSLGDAASDLLQEEWYGSFTECLNAWSYLLQQTEDQHSIYQTLAPRDAKEHHSLTDLWL